MVDVVTTRKRWLEVLGPALILGVGLAAACKKESSSDTPEAPATTYAVPADTEVTPQRAEFGLDARPVNSSCLAPARPPATGAVHFAQVLPEVQLKRIVMLAQPPGDRSRWFGLVREGSLVSFPTDHPPAQPRLVADVAAVIGEPIITELNGEYGEGGLLGFAFHPKFAENGRLYITFTTTGPGGAASEVGYMTTTDGGGSFTSYSRVLRFDRAKLEHCGGGIAFGPDGFLYLGFGDGADDTNGQKKTGFFSKILRIDVDNVPAGRTYGIPDSNPFRTDSAAEPATFAYGIRNPFRFSFDRENGELWVGDVGQEQYEEIDRVAIGSNQGWPCREGAHDYEGPPWCPDPSAVLVDPVWEHMHGPARPTWRAITGGVLYRGAAMPSLHGTYFYGDYMLRELWQLTFDPKTGVARSKIINAGGPTIAFTNFAEDVDGEIYATSIEDPRIFKLVPVAPSAPSTFPDRLSKTGCVEEGDARKPAAGLIPYSVNAPLWSDGADKERLLALPEGKTITVGSDGDLDLPAGSVLMKTFKIGGKRIETRLLVHHDDGDWAGYSYEWNDDQTDAVLLPSAKSKAVGDQTWMFPSRDQCLGCHTAAAGRSLGLEVAQLNGDAVYRSTARISNQLRTLDHIGIFSTPLGQDVSALPAFPALTSANDASVEARARAYLHANCSHCHRPEGGAGRAGLDLRFTTSLAKTKACGVGSVIDDLGVAGAKIIDPGKPESSILSLRVHATTDRRMPPLGTRRIDPEGTKLLDAWIRTLSCP